MTRIMALVFGVLKLMKYVSKDPSYITGGELEYPRELFLKIDSSGWSFVYVVLGQMTYLVASMTLDSANSCVMQGVSSTQRKISMVLFSTPFVLSWGGNISSDSFLHFILLLVVIIVTVVIVVVILIVVVGAIFGVVIVIVIIRVVVFGDVSSVLKLSFVIIGDLIGLFYSNRLGVCIPPRQGINSLVEDNRMPPLKKYTELSTTEAIQADCDVKATNIILQELPPEVYALVSTHKVAKELWERIQMLM
uniref:Retrovirus-related Pol polyprotein from transposon TNT 1-94 n=1 Tax=Tanacetum cinerariifolium TaxID=118510 RepID=A0A6L2L4J8_TANCI|nr:hypothetical protein [Tanacetum cinerariifolium]